MERITREDLDQALANHVDALERYGITYDGRLVLSTGSKTYGRAYRLHRIPSGETGHWDPPIGPDYLGMTAREAHDTLTERTRTIHDMAQALSLPRRETSRDRAEASLARDLARVVVPADWPVRVIADDESATDRVTCGECGRSWDDAVITSMTPAPAGRCPFESFHHQEWQS